MNLKTICILVIIFGFFIASCGSGRDNDSNGMDTTDYDRQNMPRDSVYPLDTTEMNIDTM